MLGSFPPGLIGITLKISVGKLGVEGQLGGHEWDYRRAEDQVLVRKKWAWTEQSDAGPRMSHK